MQLAIKDLFSENWRPINSNWLNKIL